MEKKILGISGGRANGNTDVLVNAALEECGKEGLKTNFINLSEKKILSCTVCNNCKTGDCPLPDDMPEILALLEDTDGIVIGSPTYFANVSSHVSLLMERSLPLRRHGFKLKDKVGGAIAVGASRNGGQEFVAKTIQNWFTLHGAIVVADEPPTSHFGGIGVGREKGSTESDDAGQKTARGLGRHMAKIVLKIKR